MEILNTLLLIALLIITILDKFPKKMEVEPKKEEKEQENVPKLSKEEKKKMEEAKKAFANLMGYDEKQAMRKE